MLDRQRYKASSPHKAPRRPRVLVITRNLPPLVGGMERLVWHIVDTLRGDYTVHVIGPKGCGDHLPPDVTASEVPVTPLWRFLFLAGCYSLLAAVRLRPSLVLAGSGLTAPFAWLAAQVSRSPRVVYLHGLDIEARHPIHRFVWRPFQRRCDGVFVNSRFTRNLATGIGIAAGRIRILHPGVDMPDMNAALPQRRAFRSRYGIGNTPLMLNVGRITARKGLAVFARDILPQILAALPTAMLLVIGDEANAALRHRAGEKERVICELETHGLTERAVFLDHVDDDTLSAAYFAADALVFPIQDIPGDHEGFGMVAIEAAAHGLLSVAFAAGGVPDAVREGISGFLLAPGDNIGMTESLVRVLSRGVEPGLLDSCIRFASKFSWANFDNELRHVCQQLTTPPAAPSKTAS